MKKLLLLDIKLPDAIETMAEKVAARLSTKYFGECLDAYERKDIDINNSLEAAWIDVMVASQKLLVA